MMTQSLRSILVIAAVIASAVFTSANAAAQEPTLSDLSVTSATLTREGRADFFWSVSCSAEGETVYFDFTASQDVGRTETGDSFNFASAVCVDGTASAGYGTFSGFQAGPATVGISACTSEGTVCISTSEKVILSYSPYRPR